MSGKSAIVIGATGQVGRHVLQSLLGSSEFTRVGEYGRRVTPSDQITTGKDKLEQKVIDFENIEESGLKDGKWDVAYITLGTSLAAAASNEEFVKIDSDYVVRAAKEIKHPDVSSQRIVYCSSAGADPASRFLYTRSKGLTEEHLSKLGYADTIVFRPTVLVGAERDKVSLLETMAVKVAGFLSNCSDSVAINTRTLGQSIYLAGKFGSQSLPVNAIKAGESGYQFTVVKNDAAVKLAEVKE